MWTKNALLDNQQGVFLSVLFRTKLKFCHICNCSQNIFMVYYLIRMVPEGGMAMSTAPVSVRMLGSFSIERSDQTVDDHSNRMRKVWLLLAYLIYNRNSRLSQENYLSLLHSKNGDEPADPSGNLKAMFFRARNLLNQLDDSAGRDLILRKEGTYAWNIDIPLRLDVEEFEKLCREGNMTDDETLRLNLYQQALSMYRGDFLPKLAMDSWVMPLSVYYHRIYLETVEKTLSLLEARELWEDIANLCEAALKIEPYNEALYQYLMRAKLTLDDRAAVISIYDEMSELLFSTFGVMPSEESRFIYREASRASDARSIPAGVVREQLREPGIVSGALFCDYDFFKILYQAQARSLIRSGDTVHIVLFSLQPQEKKELSRRSLDRAMDNLREMMLSSLRQGDIVTKCSVSQMIVMLPQANYENSCLVCERVVRAFYRQYPHSPVGIHFSVQPLEPMGAPTAEN